MLHKNSVRQSLSLGVLGFFVCLPMGVQAQQCDIIPDTMTRLFHPDFATYTVWSADLGEGQKQERFKSAIPQGDGVMAVGEMVRLEGVAPVLMMSRLDRRGREVWTKFLPIGGLSNVVKMLAYGEEDAAGEKGFVVLANMEKPKERSYFWLGFFDSQGKLVKQSVIKDDHFDLASTDIQFKIDGSGFLIPVSSMYSVGQGKQKVSRQNAVVYTLDSDGREISSRAFILGGNNAITSLGISKREGLPGYIATGWFENDFGKTQGWLLNLDENLSMLWQREFSRGKSAKLQESIIDKNGRYVAVGHVDPIVDGPRAAWIVSVDADDGDLIWQRYYYGETGRHDYSSIGLIPNPSGVMSFVMQATYTGEGDQQLAGSEEDVVDAQVIADDVDYVHFLTLNTRGVTITGDTYMHGQGLGVFDVASIYDGRILLSGVTQVRAEDIFKEASKEKQAARAPLQDPTTGVTLPEAVMSDKAKKGLAKLRHNISGQEHKDDESSEDTVSVNGLAESIELTDDGWIGIADAPKAYTDPCEK